MRTCLFYIYTDRSIELTTYYLSKSVDFTWQVKQRILQHAFSNTTSSTPHPISHNVLSTRTSPPPQSTPRPVVLLPPILERRNPKHHAHAHPGRHLPARSKEAHHPPHNPLVQVARDAPDNIPRDIYAVGTEDYQFQQAVSAFEGVGDGLRAEEAFLGEGVDVGEEGGEEGGSGEAELVESVVDEGGGVEEDG